MEDKLFKIDETEYLNLEIQTYSQNPWKLKKFSVFMFCVVERKDVLEKSSNFGSRLGKVFNLVLQIWTTTFSK